MFGFEEKIVSFVHRTRGQVLEAATVGRWATFCCSTGILGSRVDDRVVPGAAQLFVAEKHES